MVMSIRLPLAVVLKAKHRAFAEDRPVSVYLRRLIVAGLATHTPSPPEGPASAMSGLDGLVTTSMANAPHGTGLARLFSAEDMDRATENLTKPATGA